MKSKRAQVGSIITILIIIALLIIILIISGVRINSQIIDNKQSSESTYEDADRNLINTQDAIIKSEVQTAISMINNYYKKYKAGEMTKEQARLQAADALRNLRYGDDYTGYFWADTSKGINVVLYGNKNVEGKNRYDTTLNGVDFIHKIIANGMQPGGGYTEYYFPKYKQSEPKAKRSYSKYYEPFDWVIGTGYYIEDLN